MSDHPTVSPYLCQPLDRSYRDFLGEQIVSPQALPMQRDRKAASDATDGDGRGAL